MRNLHTVFCSSCTNLHSYQGVWGFPFLHILTNFLIAYFLTFWFISYFLTFHCIVRVFPNQCGRPGFDPWVWKIPWRRKWQPTPVFLPEESQGRRSLVGYSPQGCKELDTMGWFHFTSLHVVSLPKSLMTWF